MEPKSSLGSAWTKLPREVWGELGPWSSVLVASGILLRVSPVWVGKVHEKGAYKGENAGHNVAKGQHWKVHRSPDDFGRHRLLEQWPPSPSRTRGGARAGSDQWPKGEWCWRWKDGTWVGQDTRALMCSFAVRLSLSLVRTTWIMQVLGGWTHRGFLRI